MLKVNWFDTNIGKWQHAHVDTTEQADERVTAIKNMSNNDVPTYNVQGCWNDSQRIYVQQEHEHGR